MGITYFFQYYYAKQPKRTSKKPVMDHFIRSFLFVKVRKFITYFYLTPRPLRRGGGAGPGLWKIQCSVFKPGFRGTSRFFENILEFRQISEGQDTLGQVRLNQAKLGIICQPQVPQTFLRAFKGSETSKRLKNTDQRMKELRDGWISQIAIGKVCLHFERVIFYSSPNLLVHHQISMMHHQILKLKK